MPTLDKFIPKFQEVVVQKQDYARVVFVSVRFESNLSIPFECTEIELRKDMDYKLVAEKFRRLATQIENMYIPAVQNAQTKSKPNP